MLAGALGATVVDMRWVKPLDIDLLRALASQHECLITLEEMPSTAAPAAVWRVAR